MADTDVQITFGADSSALQDSLASVKGALEGLSTGFATLKTSLSSLGLSLAQQSLEAMGDSAKRATAQLNDLKQAWTGASNLPPPSGGQGGGLGLIKGDREKLSADKANWAEELADIQKYLADVYQAYGRDSSQYQAALHEMEAAEREHDKTIAAARKKAIEEQVAAEKKGAAETLAAAMASIEEQKEEVRAAAEAGTISVAAEYAQIEALDEQATQAKLARIDADYTATIAGIDKQEAAQRSDVNALIALERQRTAAIEQAVQQRTAIVLNGLKQTVADQAAELSKLRAQWSSAIGPVVSDFSRGLLQMAEGTKSFAQVMASLGQTILNTWVGNIDKMVTKWASGQLAQLTVSQTTAAAKNAVDAAGAARSVALTGAAADKSILSDAAAAAAAAYHAMAGIPIVGPILGAAAAATVFGAALAFRGMVASAAGGFDIPAGVNPLTQLHAEEMVLPATIARPMRSMIADYSDSRGTAGGLAAAGHSFSFGDTNIHGATRMGRDELEQVLSNHRDVLMKHFYAAVRGGSRAPLGVANPFRA